MAEHHTAHAMRSSPRITREKFVDSTVFRGAQRSTTRRLAVAIVLLLLLLSQMLTPFQTVGMSMAPTLQNGEYLLIDKVSHHLRPLGGGDIILFRAPDRDAVYVKRIIALPGDTVVLRQGQILVGTVTLPTPNYPNDHYEGFAGNLAAERTIVIPPKHVFVLGDNPGTSRDSRTFGPVALDRVIGRVIGSYTGDAPSTQGPITPPSPAGDIPSPDTYPESPE